MYMKLPFEKHILFWQHATAMEEIGLTFVVK
jgi:hypothetical protein